MAYVNDQILNNYRGTVQGRWHLTTKFYKSPWHPNKIISTITMGGSCYVMSEDISAPAHIPGEPLRVPKLDPMAGSTTTNEVPYPRNNYVNFAPAQSFETFLVQLGGAWTAIRHPLLGVVVDGFEYAIGTYILVRVGQVRQEAVHKGMLIEAELVSLPTSPNSATPTILSELLLSLPPTCIFHDSLESDGRHKYYIAQFRNPAGITDGSTAGGSYLRRRRLTYRTSQLQNQLPWSPKKTLIFWTTEVKKGRLKLRIGRALNEISGWPSNPKTSGDGKIDMV
ncbi:hypothetical protein FRC03_012734 [Tulasnella sp. 419]|nr:hypothetical protein FRC03_012734 [Tulasnella sp. 419]